MKQKNKNFNVCLAKFASTMINNLFEHCLKALNLKMRVLSRFYNRLYCSKFHTHVVYL